MWLSLKCLSSSSRRAEIALTIISLCLFTSMPSFMLWRTVILFPTQTRQMFAVHLKQTAPICSCTILHMHRSNAQSLCCTCVCVQTYGISSGRTSARMLIESVFALEVGAAASRSFKRAIYKETNISATRLPGLPE